MSSTKRPSDSESIPAKRVVRFGGVIEDAIKCHYTANKSTTFIVGVAYLCDLAAETYSGPTNYWPSEYRTMATEGLGEMYRHLCDGGHAGLVGAVNTAVRLYFDLCAINTARARYTGLIHNTQVTNHLRVAMVFENNEGLQSFKNEGRGSLLPRDIRELVCDYVTPHDYPKTIRQ